MAHSSSGRMRYAGLAGVALALCALLLAAPARSASAQAGAVERIVPATQVAEVGADVSTDLTVEAVTNLGAYEGVIAYDSALLDFVSATNGPFIGSTGRAVFCPTPVVNVLAGTMRELRYGCVTVGTAPPGASGDGTLATLTWHAVSEGDAVLSLTPSLSDELGNEIPATAFGGTLTITAVGANTPTPTGTPCPGACPTATPTSTPTPFYTPTAVPGCDGAVAAVCVAPPVAQATLGTSFDVAIHVADVTGLAGFQFELAYDPAFATAIAAAPGAFLGSSGRAVLCLPPELLGDLIRFTCITLGDTPGPASGSGTLAFVTFNADAEGTTTLNLTAVTLTGLTGNVISSVAVDGALTVEPCGGPCPTPTNTPTSTNTATATNTATPTATSTPCGGPCPTDTPTNTPTITPTFTATNTPGLPSELELDVSPVAQSVTQGAGFVVEVRALGVSNLGAYEIGLTYDEALLTFVSVEDAELLGSTGRMMSCPGLSSGVGSVRLACATLGNEPAGANGDGALARFHFTGDAVGTSALTISSPLVVEVAGTLMPVSATTNGSITVAPCGGTCPTATPTATPGAPTATPGPGGAVIGMQPPSLTESVGATFDVDISISNASNLGAFDLLLDYAYDDIGAFQPEVLEFVAFSEGPFLGSTGRPVTCLPAAVDLISVRIGCVTTGPSPDGPGGDGMLATVRFRVLKPSFRPMVIGVSPLSSGLTDPGGDSLPFTPGGESAVTITPPSGTIAPSALAAIDGDGGNGGGGPPARSPDVNSVRQTLARDRAGLLLIAALAVGLAGVVTTRNATRRSALASMLGVGVFVLAVFASPHQDASASPPVQVAPSQLTANAFAGAPPLTVEVDVVPLAEPGMGSFQVDATFNAALVSVSAVEGPFLASTGNAVSCSTTYPSPSQIRLSCAATGQPASGPTGGGAIAIFEVQPRASLDLRAGANNALLTALDLSGVVVRDVNGVVVPIAETRDMVIAVRALEGDVNGDCIVDVADHEMLASRYYRSGTMAGYDQTLDLEPEAGDADIDLADLQFVFGRRGSTCDAPEPEQNAPAVELLVDTDDDGVPDLVDNCAAVANAEQANADAAIGNGPALAGDDGTVPNGGDAGDACVSDRDNDGLDDADEDPLASCGAFDGLGALHANPAGGDITNDDDNDGDPAPPMGMDVGDDGPSWDTDNDGVRDGYECRIGTNPRDRLSKPTPLADDTTDSDADGLLNGWERRGWGTDPLVTNTDGDARGDCKEAADVDGNGNLNSTGDFLAYASAAFNNSGRTWDFDLDKNGLFNSTGDFLAMAARVFGGSPCL